MAGESNGYRAALAMRQPTPGLISSLTGTAGLPPFISFSTSYRELPPIPRRCKGVHLRVRARFGIDFRAIVNSPDPSASRGCRQDWFEWRPETPRGVLNSNQDSSSAEPCGSRAYGERLLSSYPLERFHRTRNGGSVRSQRTPRSAQTRQLLPVASRLQPIREPSCTRPIPRSETKASYNGR
jgi:hypothetical protein